MNKKSYIWGVLLLFLGIFVWGACLSYDDSIALPVITIDWKYIKDV